MDASRLGRRALGLGFVAVAVVAASAVVPLEREAGACSCAAPDATLLGPDRVDDAPVNAHVRYDTVEPPGRERPDVHTVLRAHGGAVVETTARVIAGSGGLADVELVPRAPLAPHTQYELAAESEVAVPRAVVLGTFRTGEGRDTTAPLLDSPSGVQVFQNPNAMSAACQSAAPWAYVVGVHGLDPDRPDAQLVYGVWTADAAGNVDPKKPPTVVLQTRDDVLQIGRSSICDPRRFTLPERSVVLLGIAAIDEAGNTSTLRRVRIDTRLAAPP